MTELAELVHIGMINADEVECPFDHESSEPPDINNDLIGIGTTLASKMKQASSTFLYDEYRKNQKPEAILNPRNIVNHPFYREKGKKKPAPVVIGIIKNGKVTSYAYRVTCAAHHCIPAQESLKESQLLEFMVKKDEPELLKEGDSTIDYNNGLVWSDVGYDVNGVENGVYLPGNYAVGGGRGGMGVWIGDEENFDEDDDEIPNDISLDIDLTDGLEVESLLALNEGPVEDNAPSSNRLDGSNYEIDKNNRKWRYVKQAMNLTPGQFHDRHEPYSNHVLGRLQKIHANYVLLKQKNYDNDGGCSECAKKRKKMKDLGVPTPYGLVARLNGISKSLRVYLSGKKWSQNLYTSDWVKNFIIKSR